MLKKIFLATALLASTTTVAMAFDNLNAYVGVGTGVTTNTSSNSAFGSYRGMPLNAFIGYGGVFSENFYLAGELNGTLATANISNSTILKTNYGYDLSVLPGMMLSDSTLVFGRAGIIRSRFPNQNDWSTGGKFGLGMQTGLMQNIDLRGEYDFVAYRSVNVLGGTASPRSDQFNLSLVYKFS